MSVTDASQGTASESREADRPVPVKFRYATRTALSLTLAYLIPMAMGWPQPQTAATTVMLIAATGMLSESLQKGVMRVLGTVAGAVIGLSLIALFPQDRLVYLLAASIAASLFIYLYNAYQGDSTLFMLAAVVTLMVFNGGDAEGAFLYGVDRAFMTLFGVLVYTIVASFLWPVKTTDNTRALAADVASAYSRAFAWLVRPQTGQQLSGDENLSGLLFAQETFQTHFAAVRGSADGVTDYLPEWNSVLGCYEELEGLLVPALKQATPQTLDFSHYIENYQPLVAQVEAMLRQIEAYWQGEGEDAGFQALQIQIQPGSLRDEEHLRIAAVAARAELLETIQGVLLDLNAALNSLLFDRGGFHPSREPRGKPAFLWLDLENARTALRSFVTFWIATAIWIQFNPPGGFMFVTLCTVLIPLVSYTPVTPKLLFVLFSLGFLFALPAYVFLLPQMTHWIELAAFLFTYAFIGFYVLQGPVSIFFLLGLFTLGIQNSMSYHFDAILMTILMFYMVCALLIISIHFPFTSKPEQIYCSLRRRFFVHCARQLRLYSAPPGTLAWLSRLTLGSGAALLAKMHHWGAMIDGNYFPANSQQRICEFNRSCDLLYGQLQVATRRHAQFSSNPLIAEARRRTAPNPLAGLCHKLATGGTDQPFAEVQARLGNIRQPLEELLGEDYLSRYRQRELAQFYAYLNLQASILASLQACRDAGQAMDWQQLGERRF